MIEDTSKRSAARHLAGGLEMGPSTYIEAMEGLGQVEVVGSDILPVLCQDGDAALRDLGIELGPADADDLLFRHVRLPQGWRREGSAHDMWSYVVDETGAKRVAVFYKAAFYDRRAFCRVEPDRSRT